MAIILDKNLVGRAIAKLRASYIVEGSSRSERLRQYDLHKLQHNNAKYTERCVLLTEYRSFW